MKIKILFGAGPVGSTFESGLDNLEKRINAFLQSGIRVVSPPQIIREDPNSSSELWYGIVFYEQPSSPGVNDHDRAQRSLTEDKIELYEKNNIVECRRQRLPYDAEGEEQNPPRPYKRNMSL